MRGEVREGFGAGGVMGKASGHFGSMKIYREGLTGYGWAHARRRRLNLVLGRSLMHTYGGMCHEHEGVILCIGATDEVRGRARKDFMASTFWEIGWIHNPSIIVEGLVVCNLWRGCFALRDGLLRSRRVAGT